MPQVGPITMWVISMTLTPSSGNPVPAIVVSRSRSFLVFQTRLPDAI
jgi:hypothetical protein